MIIPLPSRIGKENWLSEGNRANIICPNYLNNKNKGNYVVDTEHIDEQVPVQPNDLKGVHKQVLTNNYFVDT